MQIDIVPRLFELVGPERRRPLVEGLPLLGLPSAASCCRSRARSSAGSTSSRSAFLLAAHLAALRLHRVADPAASAAARCSSGRSGSARSMQPFTALKFRTMKVDTDDDRAPRVHPRDDGRERDADGERPLQARAARRDHAVRPLAAQDEPRRAAAADQRPARRDVARRPAACLAYETELFEPHHFERFLRPGRDHRALAGDRARPLHVRRSARARRRLRARLVARPRPACCCSGRRSQLLRQRKGTADEHGPAPRRCRRPRLLGPEPRPQPARTRATPRSPAICDLDAGRARARSAGATRPSARRRSFDERARRPDGRRGRDRDPRLDARAARRCAALEAGKHVFVEKPLAASSAEARAADRRSPPTAASC